MSSDKLDKKKRNLPKFTEAVTLLGDYLDEADPVRRLEYPYKMFESIKKDTLDYGGDSTDYTMPYAEISTLIYREDFINDDIDILVDQGREYINRIEVTMSSVTKQKSIARNVQKFCEHVQLASIQKNVLYKEQVEKIKELEEEADELDDKIKNSLEKTDRVTEDIKKKTEKSNSKLAEFTEKLNQASEDTENIQDTIDRINMDAVGMIGLFSTIIFSVFGGLTYITSVGENLQNIRIYKLLIYASLSAILLLTIVFMSYLAISRLTKTELDLKSCCNEKNCNHVFWKRYPYFWAALSFFLGIFILGGLVPIL